MDKYDQHLQFLIQALPHKTSVACQHIFLDTAKRDVRKALFYLLQPIETEDFLVAKFIQTKADQPQEQAKLIFSLLHWYCPNPSFTKIVTQVSKDKPIKIDSATVNKLKRFRRVPTKEVLLSWFQLVKDSDELVILQLLKGLKSFDWSLEPCWSYLDYYANSTNLELAKAALVLLSQTPNGIQQSIGTLNKHLNNSQMRFAVLTSLQQTIFMDNRMLLNLLTPVITAYRRLMHVEGPMNDLWQEFRLVQNIAKNNGIVLSIPDIGLKRF